MSLTRRVVVLFGALAASPALACKVQPTPMDLFTRAYDAAVEVRIQGVRRMTNRISGWRATGVRTRIFYGEPEPTDFQFGLGEIISSCDEHIAAPTPGEFWVLYLRRSDGRWEPTRYYPLSIALCMTIVFRFP